MASLFTYGLDQIEFNDAKVGMVYRDTAKIQQENPEVTEFYEEGKATPALSLSQGKTPKLTFSIMNPDAEFLQTHVGGTYDAPTKKWSFDGTEVVSDGKWDVTTKKGLDILIPKGKATAKINFDISDKSLLLVDFEVTPIDPGTAEKPFQVVQKA